jgi:hypothetical protein
MWIKRDDITAAAVNHDAGPACLPRAPPVVQKE